MPTVLRAALIYFGVVFAAAFLIGVLRVTLVAPKIGALAAVALEVPLILGLSWLVAGRVLARWPLVLRRRIAMGVLAFVCLMLVEFSMAVLLFGQTPSSYMAAFAQPPGLLGLAGQVGFALIPALRPQLAG